MKTTNVSIQLSVPEGMNFMRIANAVQQLANSLKPGARISHDGTGFHVDASIQNLRNLPLYESPEERAA